MNILNQETTFEGIGLYRIPSAKTYPLGGSIILTYLNSESRPLLVDIIAYVGTSTLSSGESGLLSQNNTEMTMGIKVSYNPTTSVSPDYGFYFFPGDTRLNLGNRSHFWKRNRIFVPEGDKIDIYAASENTSDDSIDGFIYVAESLSGANVETIGGEPPITVNDIIQDYSNPSGTPEPIRVDDNGRIQISGTNNNTLDDFVDSNGRVNVSKR